MDTKRLITGAAAALLACGLMGCEAGGERPNAQATLDDVQIPADFTFATTKGLTVVAEGDPARLTETMAEVRLANGELVHRGTLVAPIQLAIPLSTQKLQVSLRSNTHEATVEVPVVDGRAVVEVQ